MAFGFPPKFQSTQSLNNLKPTHWLVIAKKACENLGWNIHEINTDGFNAFHSSHFNGTGEAIKFRIQGEIVTITSNSTGGQLLDLGRNKRRIQEFVKSFETSQAQFTEDELIDLSNQLIQQIEQLPEEDRNLSEIVAPSLFKLSKGYEVTPIIILINVLLFVGMILSGANIMIPDNEHLINWGANFAPLTLDGQWWRLITNIFEHIGIFHLLMNMYGLLYIGILLEPMIGRNKFLLAYLLTGIAGSAASLWWHDYTISAGASGAIFGMYGIFIALLSTNLISKSFKQTFLTSALLFTGFNLINGFKPNSGIDNAAHIGGLVTGIIIGYAFYFSLKEQKTSPFTSYLLPLISVFVIAISGFVLTSKSNDLPKADRMLADFSANEEKALSIYKTDDLGRRNISADNIKNISLPLWNKNKLILDSVMQLSIPEESKSTIKLYKNYVDLRIKYEELLKKSIEENTKIYDSQLMKYGEDIQKALEVLNN